jgi:hypothetical protein
LELGLIKKYTLPWKIRARDSPIELAFSKISDLKAKAVFFPAQPLQM